MVFEEYSWHAMVQQRESPASSDNCVLLLFVNQNNNFTSLLASTQQREVHAVGRVDLFDGGAAADVLRLQSLGAGVDLSVWAAHGRVYLGNRNIAIGSWIQKHIIYAIDFFCAGLTFEMNARELIQWHPLLDKDSTEFVKSKMLNILKWG